MSNEANTLREVAEGCFARAFDGVVRIECIGDGSSLWVDGRPAKPTVSPLAPPELVGRFCLWRGEAATLRSVMEGQRQLETAFTAGHLKISGDMSVMARLKLGPADA